MGAAWIERGIKRAVREKSADFIAIVGKLNAAIGENAKRPNAVDRYRSATVEGGIARAGLRLARDDGVLVSGVAGGDDDFAIGGDGGGIDSADITGGVDETATAAE